MENKIQTLREAGVIEVPKSVLCQYLGIPDNRQSATAFKQMGLKKNGSGYVLLEGVNNDTEGNNTNRGG